VLRITDSRHDASRVITLEGKLLEAWVDEVRGLFVGIEAASFPKLDLSDLSYVDRAGAELLQNLLRQGIQIRGCSPFVAELLNWERQADR
jgi:hypothetical protein